MTFCDQRPGNVTQLDLTYLACYDRFENMKACFWHNLSQEQETEQEAISSQEDEAEETLTQEEERPHLRVGGSARTFRAKTFN
ncbi:unnamed protein product [Cylicostephanus goldi]|uniref:Uncharacterized protein n=1 Tax=Cylicostephanus goldi TaxID=71465 RepID=A0A3P7Q901_CYLGO|nr:unnamed protein product [Cylicostephanus goldi]